MSALPEAEAKTKWCPFARVSKDGGGNRYPWDTDLIHGAFARCLGSDCMSWRWQPCASMDNPTRVPGAGIQTLKPERGFCGLAGSP